MKHKYRVIVDREKCLGCGAAPSIAPEIFTLAPDINKNKVVDMYEKEYSLSRSIGEIPEELVEKAKKAAEICPVKAIKIEPLM